MLRFVKSLLLLSVLTVGSAAAAEDIKWEQVSDDGTVQVYKATIPGSPFVAFKGVRVMDAPITKVAGVLLTKDIDVRKKWVAGLVKSDDLEVISPYERVIYTAYDFPWPIADRDYVTNCKLEISSERNEVVVTMTSVEHPKAPSTVGVRAVLMGSSYRMVPLPGNKTEVSVDIRTDPKGLLPAWLVNGIQAGWPAWTLGALEREAKVPGVKEDELVKARFNGMKVVSK